MAGRRVTPEVQSAIFCTTVFSTVGVVYFNSAWG